MVCVSALWCLSEHLPCYLGFSYLGRGVSLQGCSSKAQPLLLTLDEDRSLLTAIPPYREHGVAPLGPPAPMQPPLLGCGVAPPGHHPWPRAWGSSSLPHFCAVGCSRHASAHPEVKSLSCVRLFATPWTVAHQAPLSMGFSRQEYWSGLPFPSPGDLPNPGIKPRSPALQADALTSEPPGKHFLETVNVRQPPTQPW